MSISQQAFLRDAMRRLNLTRDVFAAPDRGKRRALDTWLLPEGLAGISRDAGSGGTLRDGDRAERRPARKSIRKACRTGPCATASAWKASISCCRWTSSPRVGGRPVPHRRYDAAHCTPAKKVSACWKALCWATCSSRPARGRASGFGSAFCRLGGSVCDTTGFTFSSDGQGRIDLRHQPRDERLRRCHGHTPS